MLEPDFSASLTAPVPIGGVQRQILINSAAIVICRVSLALVNILAVPFIIKYLGISGFGSWETIYSVAAIFMVLAQGLLGTTMNWRMSISYGQGNIAYIRRLARIASIVPYFLLLLVGPIIWLFRNPLIHWLNLPEAMTSPALIIFPAVVGFMLLYGLFEIWGAVLTAFQQAGLTAVLQTGARIMYYFGAVAGLMMGARLWGLFIAFALSIILSLAGTYLAARHKCSRLSLLPVFPSRDESRSLLRYASLMIVGTAAWAVRTCLIKILLAALESAEWVGFFSIASLLAVAVYEACSFFLMPTIAAVGALYGQNDWGGIKKIYGNMMVIIAFFSGMSCILVLGFYDRIMIFWMGRLIPQVVPILILLVIGNTIAVILTGAGTAVCRGIGRVEIETRYMLLGLVLNALLIILLMTKMGGIGIVIAGSLSWALSAVYFQFILHRKLDLPFSASLGGASSLPVVAFIIIGARLLLSRIPLPTRRLTALRDIFIFGTMALVGYFCLMLINPTFRQLAASTTRRIRGRMRDLLKSGGRIAGRG